MKLFILFATAVVVIINVTTEKPKYSDSFIAHYLGEEKELDNLLFNYGYSVDKKIFTHFFKVTRNRLIRASIKEEISYHNLNNVDKKIHSFYREELFSRDKRSTNRTRATEFLHNVTDSFWSKQWYLHPQHTPGMKVYDTWSDGYSGKGIIIAIVDDGIDTNHSDLAGNYNASLSTNIIGSSNDPSHIWPSEGHGTKCAGVVAAVQNNYCVVGIAYEATLTAIRLLDDYTETTAIQEANALTSSLDSVDIYSNSWGPTDDGAGFDTSDRLSDLQNAALIDGVTLGRGGKGAIYVWASGNGGDVTDDCNVDGYSNSMYTISISAARPDGSKAWYAEECTAIMAVTYGGDEYFDQIATTYRDDQCIDDFQGTSAACPVAAGIIALALQANPQLSWRDIQHLVVETATNSSILNANFYTNGVGKRVSLSHGFGLMNAKGMVDLAISWQTVPKRIHCDVPALNTNSSSSGTKSLKLSNRIDNCFIGYLEHVLITLVYKVLWREYTSIYLISPLGTESRILRERKKDSETSTVDWTFMSLHTWGENPVGTWSLRLDSTKNENMDGCHTFLEYQLLNSLAEQHLINMY